MIGYIIAYIVGYFIFVGIINAVKFSTHYKLGILVPKTDKHPIWMALLVNLTWPLWFVLISIFGLVMNRKFINKSIEYKIQEEE